MKRTIHPRNNLYLKLLLLLACLCRFDAAHASHVVGSDIAYTCTATPGIWHVTLIIYRDCSGQALCSNALATQGPCSLSTILGQVGTLKISGADPSCQGVVFANADLALSTVRDADLDSLCPQQKSICINRGAVQPGTGTPGVERYLFEGDVNLGPTSGIPSSCCNVRMSWELCCRNGAIVTGSGGQNYYVEAIINRCLSLSPCNSSPVLKNDPFAIVCSGSPYTFNNGAVDPDFDSLSYSFTPSLQGAGNSVTYISPYSYDAPMPWTGAKNGIFPSGISCDPHTGDISFYPTYTGAAPFVGVMAVEIKQWKTINGMPTVIGITRRDLQMWLMQCPPNNTPRLVTLPSGPGNTPKTSWSTCAGTTLCFDIIAKDTDFNPPNLSDTTYLSWNAALASLGATFTPNYDITKRSKQGPREDTYKFCWTPTDEMASSLDYYFTVNARDNRCGNVRRTSRGFAIRVLPNPSVTIMTQTPKCGATAIWYKANTARKDSTFSITSYTISREPYDYSFSNNPIQFNDGSGKTVHALSFSKGGKYLVSLTLSYPPGIDGQICSRTFYDTILVDTPAVPVLRDTFACLGTSATLTASAKFGKPTYQFRWFNNIKDTVAPLNTFFTSATYTPNPAPVATRKYTLQVRDINGCRSWDSMTVFIRQLPVGTLPDSNRLCFGQKLILDPGDYGGRVKKFLWNTADTTQTIERGDSNLYIVKMTDTSGCVQSDSIRLYVNRPILPNAGLDTSICLHDTATLIGRGGQLYAWRNLSTNTTVLAKGYVSSIKVSPSNTSTPTMYELTAYVSYPDTTLKYKQCSNTDTVVVTVKSLPILSRPQAVQACRSATLLSTPAYPANPAGGTGVWTYPAAPGAIVPATPTTQIRVDSLKQIPQKDTNVLTPFVNWIRYKYTGPVIAGEPGCTQTDSAAVNIYALPYVVPGPPLTWCQNAGVYNITANQGYAPLSLDGSQDEWTGNGIYSQTVGAKKVYFFDPTRTGVVMMPSVNTQTYKYTRIYNSGQPTQISCFNDSTVAFKVTPTPVIDAGSDVIICKNEAAFTITQKTGATITPLTGASRWTFVKPGATSTTAQRDFQNHVAGDSLTFMPGASDVPNPAAPTYPTGMVTYKIFFSDNSTGCLVYDSANITVANSPDVSISRLNLGDSITCKNTGILYLNTNVNGIQNNTGTYGGSPAFSLNPAGSSPGNSRFDSDNPAVVAVQKLIYAWSKTYNIPGGASATCADADTVNMYVQPPPSIAVTPGGAICADRDSIPVSIASSAYAFSYTWSALPNAGTGGDGSFTGLHDSSGWYLPSATDKTNGTVNIMVKTDPFGSCPQDSDQTALTINKMPLASILCTDCEHCVPFDATLTADNPGVPATFGWTWDDNYAPSSGQSVIRNIPDYEGTGKYMATLTVTSSAGCVTVSSPATVTAHAIPKAAFTWNPPFTTIAKPFFDFTNLSTISDNSALSYTWRFEPLDEGGKDRISHLTNPKSIEYAPDTGDRNVWLTATSPFGCVDSIKHKLTIQPDITVFIPNAFHPGSDAPCRDQPNCNSKFRVAADGYLNIEIFIFNRWGQQVFHTADAAQGWDGTYKGEQVPQDVYIYQVNASSHSGKQYRYSGSVTLLR